MIHDGTYSIDFATTSIGGVSSGSSQASDASGETGSGSTTPGTAEERAEFFAEDIISRIKQYRDEHLYKFVGAGLTTKVVQTCPQLPSRLWLELDIVPLVLEPSSGRHNTGTPDAPNYLLVDEEADAVVRKALGYVREVVCESTLTIPGSSARLINLVSKSFTATKLVLTVMAWHRSPMSQLTVRRCIQTPTQQLCTTPIRSRRTARRSLSSTVRLKVVVLL